MPDALPSTKTLDFMRCLGPWPGNGIHIVSIGLTNCRSAGVGAEKNRTSSSEAVVGYDATACLDSLYPRLPQPEGRQ